MCTTEQDLRVSGTAKGRPVTIQVNGKGISAHEGESVLAALTAAGIIILNEGPTGESAGTLCGMGICYQCRVTIDGVPDRRACMNEVRDGMEILTHEPGRNSNG